MTSWTKWGRDERELITDTDSSNVLTAQRLGFKRTQSGEFGKYARPDGKGGGKWGRMAVEDLF